MDVFVVRACSLASTARPLIASSVPSYNLWEIAVVVLGISLLLIAGSWLRLLYFRIGLLLLHFSPYDVTGTSFPRVLLLALLEVFKGPWLPLGVEGRWPWRWWPGCMFQHYIRCCPFLPVVGCLLTLQGATPRRGGQLPRGEIRLQEEVLCRHPLAQRGRLSGLTKDKLNSFEG